MFGLTSFHQGQVSPLEFAVDCNASPELVQCLIEAGADVGHVDFVRRDWVNANPNLESTNIS